MSDLGTNGPSHAAGLAVLLLSAESCLVFLPIWSPFCTCRWCICTSIIEIYVLTPVTLSALLWYWNDICCTRLYPPASVGLAVYMGHLKHNSLIITKVFMSLCTVPCLQFTLVSGTNLDFSPLPKFSFHSYLQCSVPTLKPGTFTWVLEGRRVSKKLLTSRAWCAVWFTFIGSELYRIPVWDNLESYRLLQKWLLQASKFWLVGNINKKN